MLIQNDIYINTNRDFYDDYVDVTGVEYQLTFTHKESNEVITFTGTTILPNLVNRYFIITIDVTQLEHEGWYQYDLELKNVNSTNFDLYEIGLGLKQYSSPNIYSDDEDITDTTFVDED